MILWGAIWGALISALVSRYGGDWEWIVGAMLGALAGWTLRKAVRNEIMRLAKWPTVQHKSPEAITASPAQAQTEPVAEGASTPPSAVTTGGLVGSPAIAAAQIPGVEASTSASGLSPPASPVPVNAAAEAPKAAPASALARDPIAALVKRVQDWLLGGNTVARVGAIVLFIGLSFLAKWAADNSLFPPELRLAGIGLVGVALLVQGARLSNRTNNDATGSNYAILLQGAGVAVLYLAIFAAFKLYAMIPAMVAFVLMALVCALSTVIALLRNAQALAFAGFAGAFATPILLSTGGGSHVALFSYYLLLNVAIAVVAYLRAWRLLNLLGFFSTFLVATAWGALKYDSGQYASTQPFLIAFFAIYVLIGLFYALRHTDTPKHTLDGMLIFGTPIVTFALQTQLVQHVAYGAAISAVVMSAIYVLLAFALRRRESPAATWLTLSYAALGLIFATLSIPLAFDGRLTAAIWAIEGAGVYWLATKQQRSLGQAFGAAMQMLAALIFLAELDHVLPKSVLPFANSQFIGALMLAMGSLAISWWAFVASRDMHTETSAASDASWANGKVNVMSGAGTSTLFFLLGFAWLVYGVWSEVLSSAVHLSDSERLAWFTFSFVALVFCAFLAWKTTGWASARLPVAPVLPFLIVCATLHVALSRGSLWFDLLLWPLCFALHLIMLRGVDALSPARWWRIVHAGNTLLLILLLGGFLNRVIDAAELRQSDWAAVTLIVASTFIMLGLASRRVWAESSGARQLRWPLARFQRQYAVQAGFGVAALTTLGALIMAGSAGGNVAPLPYVALFNPVDLCAFLALTSVAVWIKRLRASTLVAASSRLRSSALPGVLAFAAFIVVNTVWLRFAHHFRGIEWSSGALAESFFVQAGYSVLWTLLGVAAMFIGHRKGARVIWQAGAMLLALTVVKLLVVDLANSGGGERIVAFIGVGVLMVAVGYFAPLPPARAKVPAALLRGETL